MFLGAWLGMQEGGSVCLSYEPVGVLQQWLNRASCCADVPPASSSKSKMPSAKLTASETRGVQHDPSIPLLLEGTPCCCLLKGRYLVQKERNQGAGVGIRTSAAAGLSLFRNIVARGQLKLFLMSCHVVGSTRAKERRHTTSFPPIRKPPTPLASTLASDLH